MSPIVQASKGQPSSLLTLSCVVAIPVRNERDRISDCLDALLRQSDVLPGTFGILLFLNNCTDDTRSVVELVAETALSPIRIIEEHSDSASAGWARRRAMDAAADWLESDGNSDGVLLTTDADSRVGVDWVSKNLAAHAQGADAVAGRIELDSDDAARLPASLHARGRLESEYEALLTEIIATLDPEPGNPWPCHWAKSGATISVRLAVYRQIGGLPDMPVGEDRALIDAICARDLVVRHAPDIVVITSGRLEGRATGGVAETMKLRCERPDSFCDERLELLTRVVARVFWRKRLKRLHRTDRLASTRRWAPALKISAVAAAAIALLPHCGQALAAIEAKSPRLVLRPVRPSELPRQIRLARVVLTVVRWSKAPPLAAITAVGHSPRSHDLASACNSTSISQLVH